MVFTVATGAQKLLHDVVPVKMEQKPLARFFQSLRVPLVLKQACRISFGLSVA